MLNELLRNCVKTTCISSHSENAMMTVDVASAANDATAVISSAPFKCLGNPSTMSHSNSSGDVRCTIGSMNGGSPSGGDSPLAADMAQHMLRNILQGVGCSKKDLYALECELNDVAGNKKSKNHRRNSESELEIDCKNDATLNNNNNNFHTNNNHKVDVSNAGEVKAEIKAEEDDFDDENCDVASTGTDNMDRPDASPSPSLMNGDDEHFNVASETNDRMEQAPYRCNNDHEMNDGCASDQSISSPESICNNNNNNNNNNNDDDDDDDDDKEDLDEPFGEYIRSRRSEQKDLKRARVENIVSCMRSSPLLPVPVNGCKKRKLYHPQQHDNSCVAERYTGFDLVNDLSDDEDEISYSAEMREKVVQKNELKNQLRTVQEQLAEMQQKYAQLCTRVDPEPEPEPPADTDEIASDVDQERSIADAGSPKVDPVRVRSPGSLAAGKDSHVVAAEAFHRRDKSPSAPKMLSSKFWQQNVAAAPNASQLGPHSLFPTHPSFNNSTISFLQHQILQEQQHAVAAAAARNSRPPHRHSGHHNPPYTHPAFGNLAAMYLGVNQKLLLEQETRVAKELALAAAAKQQQHRKSQPCEETSGQSALRSLRSAASEERSQSACARHTNPSNGPSSKKSSSSSSCAKNGHSTDALSNALASRLHASASSSALSPTSAQPLSSSSSSSLLSTKSRAEVTTPPATSGRSDAAAAAAAAAAASPPRNVDFEGLADSLKTEITTTLSSLIDSIMSRFVEQKSWRAKICEADPFGRDSQTGSQQPSRRSPHGKVSDRGGTRGSSTSAEKNSSAANAADRSSPSKGQLASGGGVGAAAIYCGSVAAALQSPSHHAAPEANLNAPNMSPNFRSGLNPNLFSLAKAGAGGLASAAAAAANPLYSPVASGLAASHLGPFGVLDVRTDCSAAAPEQNEALSLVVPQKKKRHKVTDTRITPRTVSRILAQDGMSGPPPSSALPDASKYGVGAGSNCNGGADSPPSAPPPPPRSFHHVPPPAPMLPASLPTSVAIPNPSLHESQIYSPYSPFYGGQHQPPHHLPTSALTDAVGDRLCDSPPLPHHASVFHQAILATSQQQQQQQHQHQHQREQQSHHQRAASSPDFAHLLLAADASGDNLDPGSESNSMDLDGLPFTSTTLSPMHLRKAKLMFFWVRYPTSAVLKMYFPDIRFNKNNTAQLVKWFSNFREFYYNQMEKYARTAIADGIKNADDIHVSIDSDIYRVLNLHYNRNNHIEVPSNFRYVVEQTLKEFFKAVQNGKDQDQSWKKPIYKVIGRLDDPVPEYFKSPNFLEQLE